MYSYPWSSPGSPLAQGVRQASREGGVALISQTVNNLSVIDVIEQLFNQNDLIYNVHGES